jgi:hypothetical protein
MIVVVIPSTWLLYIGESAIITHTTCIALKPSTALATQIIITVFPKPLKVVVHRHHQK